MAPSSTRFNPATPFVSNWSTFFGSPNYNGTYANVQTGMAFIEHDFGNGLSVKNATIYASYLRGYRNIYPGNGALSGAVNPAETAMNLAAYENATNRNNLFNQTDFTYKTVTGPVRHTLTFGTEFGLQAGFAQRDTGFFPAERRRQHDRRQPVRTDLFRAGLLHPQRDAAQTDASSRSDLYVQSGYVQDQIELTRWLQLIAGVRYDRFDFTALDQNTNTTRSRVDEKVSPRAAVIVKPVENRLDLRLLRSLVSAGVRRPVQRVERRHAHSRAAEVREQGSRRQMEHQPAAAVHRRGL